MRVRVRRSRLRVRVQVQGSDEDDWQRVGREHFLTRSAYQATREAMRQVPGRGVVAWLRRLVTGE